MEVLGWTRDIKKSGTSFNWRIRLPSWPKQPWDVFTIIVLLDMGPRMSMSYNHHHHHHHHHHLLLMPTNWWQWEKKLSPLPSVICQVQCIP